MLHGVQYKVQSENPCSINVDEVHALKLFINSYTKHCCAKVKSNMFNQYQLAYMNEDNQLEYENNPKEYFNAQTVEYDNAPTVEVETETETQNNNSFSIATGIWPERNYGFTGMEPSDEAYNNFIHLINIIGEDISDPDNVEVPANQIIENQLLNNNNINKSCLQWLSELVMQADYISPDVKKDLTVLDGESFNTIYNVLHIDVIDCHSVSIYDSENKFLVDRSTLYSTEKSSEHDATSNISDEYAAIISEGSSSNSVVDSVFTNNSVNLGSDITE